MPAKRFGDYDVLAPLGQGGMGEVFLARQRGPGGFARPVALKVLRQGLDGDEGARRLFFDEAQLLGRLRHPSVAQVYGFGEAEGRLYLAMEYVAGVSFARLRRQVGLAPEVAARLVAAAARGLHAAHTQVDVDGRALEVVHRDVSPHNLMLAFDGGVKVLDFGIALHRMRTSELTAFGVVRGKPSYLCPEVLAGAQATRLSDVWSLGVVLYELLTARPLFAREHELATFQAVLQAPILSPAEAQPALSSGLCDAVMAALEREPSRRVASALELAESLERAVAPVDLSGWLSAELSEERAAHREWLEPLLEAPPPPLAPPGGVGGGGPERTATLEVAPRRRWRWLLAAAVIASGLAGGLWALVPRGVVLGAQPPPSIDSALAPAPALEPEPAPAPRAGTPPAPPDPQPGAVGAVQPSPAPTAASPLALPHRRRSEPAQRRRAVPPEAPARGLLTVTAEPYGLVRVDDALVGPTPVFDLPVVAGLRAVELVAPDTGEVRARRTVRVSEGQAARLDFQ